MSAILSETLAYWETGGPLLAAIGAVCLGIWLYFLRARGRLATALAAPPDFEETLATRLATASPRDVLPDYEGKTSVPAQAVSYVLRHVAAGATARDAFTEFESMSLEPLDRDLVVLGALTTMAPLMGLLGTVMGMVTTFGAVATTSTGTSGSVAAGISHALITTQLGLIVAIPGVFGIARLQRLLDQVRIRLAGCRSHLILGLEQHA